MVGQNLSHACQVSLESVSLRCVSNSVAAELRDSVELFVGKRLLGPSSGSGSVLPGFGPGPTKGACLGCGTLIDDELRPLCLHNVLERPCVVGSHSHIE